MLLQGFGRLLSNLQAALPVFGLAVPRRRAQRQDLLPLLIKFIRFGRYRNVGDTLMLDFFDCYYCCFDLVGFWSLSNILFIFRDLGRVPFLPAKLLRPSVLASSSTRPNSEFATRKIGSRCSAHFIKEGQVSHNAFQTGLRDSTSARLRPDSG